MYLHALVSISSWNGLLREILPGISDDLFNSIFFNESGQLWSNILLMFFLWVLTHKKSALVHGIDWPQMTMSNFLNQFRRRPTILPIRHIKFVCVKQIPFIWYRFKENVHLWNELKINFPFVVLSKIMASTGTRKIE